MSDSFTSVPNSLLDHNGLTTYEKMIAIVLLRFAFGTGKCWPSLRTIAERASLGRATVQRNLDSLIQKGIVKKEERYEKGTRERTSNAYYLTLGVLPVSTPIPTESIPYTHREHTGIPALSNEEEQEGRRKEEKKSSPQFSQEAKDILDYLNRQTGKSFRHSKSSLAPIQARLNDNFSPEELKRVVDHKVKTWGPDPKMQEYIRPQTLFQASKFEAYVNAAPEIRKTASVEFVECAHCGEPVLKGDTICPICKANIEEAQE